MCYLMFERIDHVHMMRENSALHSTNFLSRKKKFRKTFKSLLIIISKLLMKLFFLLKRRLKVDKSLYFQVSIINFMCDIFLYFYGHIR